MRRLVDDIMEEAAKNNNRVKGTYEEAVVFRLVESTLPAMKSIKHAIGINEFAGVKVD